MTQEAGLSPFRLARAASTDSRLVVRPEALLPLLEWSVRLLVLMEPKPSYCVEPRISARQEGHEFF